MSVHTSAGLTTGTLMGILLPLLGATTADADSRGVQYSFDGVLTFVSKDVGAERYAITREPDDTLTGNVFFTDERSPAFIVCDPLGDFAYRCRVAEACDLSACNTTPCKVTGEPVIVNLPTDFFLPSTEQTASTVVAPPRLVVAKAATSQCASLGPEEVARGIQQSSSGGRIFVNKDVAGQRYAITKYASGRVTGNIFFEDGSSPRFLDCQLGTGNGLTCHLADACPPAPLPCSFVNAQGNDEIVTASLPDGFFGLCPEILEFISDVRTALGGACLRVGAAPIPQPGAPVTVEAVRGNTIAPPGSSNDLGVDYDASAQVSTSAGIAVSEGLTFLVAVAPASNAAARVTGYFEIPLDDPSGTLELTVDISQSFRGDFELEFATSAAGVSSNYRTFRQHVPLIGPIGEGGQAHAGARPPGAPEAPGGPPRL